MRDVDKKLFKAIENSSISQALDALKDGADVNELDGNGCSALVKAVDARLEDFVKLLLKKGANPNITAGDNQTALHVAAKKGCTNLVETLVKAGADVNLKSKCHDWTPLHMAAMNDAHGAAKVLLKAGAEIDAEDDDGKTAFNHAMKRENSGIVRLIEKCRFENDPNNFWNRISSAVKKGAMSGVVNSGANAAVKKAQKALGNPQLLQLPAGQGGLKMAMGVTLISLANNYPNSVPHADLVAAGSKLLMEASTEEITEEFVEFVEPLFVELGTALIEAQAEQELLEDDTSDVGDDEVVGE